MLHFFCSLFDFTYLFGYKINTSASVGRSLFPDHIVMPVCFFS